MHSSEKRRVRSIVARATPLWDRTFDASYAAAPLDPENIQRRLVRWQEILGGRDGLRRRLRSTDLNGRTVRKLLRGASSTAEDQLPAWAATLESIFDPQRELSPVFPAGPPCDPSSPLPFQEILMDLVNDARQRIRSQPGSASDVLQPSAVTTFERHLLAHLTFIASLAIGQDFYEFRFQTAPASVLEFAWQQQARSQEIYLAYVTYMRTGGFLALLDRYPVLARLLCESIEQWIKTTSQFCQRFREDFSDLQTFFHWKVERPAGAIAQLRTGLSDRHQGGQTVTECVLSSGERIFYKPRSLGPEIAFYQFISWLNRRRLGCKLKVLRALDRTTHGWIESVDCIPCQNVTQVDHFYTRAGMLLAILHVVGVTDIHCENLIAHRDQPVVVDLETLVNGGAPAPAPKFSIPEREETLENDPSVLNTGLLPLQFTSRHGQKFDMSALGSDGTQDPDVKVMSWQAINSDQMSLTGIEKHESPLTHRVRLGNQLPSVADHLPAFLTGFKKVYFCLLKHRSQLSDDDLLTAFDDLNLRILIRGTATYTRLHLYLLHPEFLKDGIDRSIELEWLARPLSGMSAPSEGRQLVYEWERTAMENLDIPRFSTSALRNLKYTPGDEDLWALYGEHNSSVIRTRLASLSADDYVKQCGIIENAIRSRFME